MRIYNKYELPITASTILSLSTFIVLYLESFPNPLITISPIVLKLSIIAISILAIRHVPAIRITSFGVVIFFSALIYLTGLFIVDIFNEFLPHQYFAFPLADPKGSYVINYDGDYWLTYYEAGQKKGNTSITESPEDLKRFIDKSVRIVGEFVPIRGQISGDQKKFCIIDANKKTCHTSTGPGTWYASPLKINSIEKQ
jgi:hypothetical protein